MRGPIAIFLLIVLCPIRTFAQAPAWVAPVLQETANLLRTAEVIHQRNLRIVPSVVDRFSLESFPRMFRHLILTDTEERARRLGRDFYDQDYLVRHQIAMFRNHLVALTPFNIGMGEALRVTLFTQRATHSFLNMQAAVRYYIGAMRDAYLVDESPVAANDSTRRQLVDALSLIKWHANRVLERFPLPETAVWKNECRPIRTAVNDPRSLAYESFPFYSFPREDEARRPLADYDYSNYLTGLVLHSLDGGFDLQDPEAWNRRWNLNPRTVPQPRP